MPADRVPALASFDGVSDKVGLRAVQVDPRAEALREGVPCDVTGRSRLRVRIDGQVWRFRTESGRIRS